MQALIHWLNQSIATLPDLMQALVWVGVISLGLIGVYLIFSLIFSLIFHFYSSGVSSIFTVQVLVLYLLSPRIDYESETYQGS